MQLCTQTSWPGQAITLGTPEGLGWLDMRGWHLRTVAMGLQGSLLLQNGGSVLGGGGAVEIREAAGRAPLVPVLAPAAPLFSGAPSESRSSPSREGDGLVLLQSPASL